MDLVRPTFYPGQVLTAEDFERIVTYTESLLRQHNLLTIGEGVARGLTVRRARTAGVLRVEAGYAIDGLGRTIEVGSETTLTVPAGFDGVVVALVVGEPVEPAPSTDTTDGDVISRAQRLTSVVTLSGSPPPHSVVLAQVRHGRLFERS